MKKVGFIELSDVINNFSITPEEVKYRQIIQKLKDNWSDIVGPIFKNHSKPLFLQKQKLVIAVENSSYKQEFLFIKNSIIKQIKVKLKLNVNFIEIRIARLSFKEKKVEKSFEKKGTLVGKDNLLKLVEKEPDLKIQKKIIELIKFL